MVGEPVMSLKPSESIIVSDTVVACDGGGGALGHPRVFLHMGPERQVECPYCDRLFILDKKAAKKTAASY
jgi:uncharacterized Zn-finger protein